jgi:hypothetical protein
MRKRRCPRGVYKTGKLRGKCKCKFGLRKDRKACRKRRVRRARRA